MVSLVAGFVLIGAQGWGGVQSDRSPADAGPARGSGTAFVTNVVSALRRAPDDAAVLAPALQWARRRGGVAVLLGGLLDGPSVLPRDLHIAARIWEENGRPDRAFDLYRRALAGVDPLPATRVRLVALLLRAGWAERAEAVWNAGSDARAASAETEKLDFLVAAARGQVDRARELLNGARHATAEDRARWALEADHAEWAAEIWEGAGQNGPAVTAWLRAGRAHRALARWRATRPQIDDETALALARADGQPTILEHVLGARDDADAEALRRRLGLSLGVVERIPVPPAPAPAVDLDPDTTRSTAGGTQGSIPPSPKDTRLRSEAELVRDPGELPSLAAAAASLTAGREDDAREEWVRWQLTPRPEEADTWLPVLRRAAPHWFRAPRTPRDVVVTVESAQVHDPLESTAPRVAIDRALLEVPCGSDLEAELLFHRGRLLGSRDDWDRAVRIGRDVPVTVRRADLRIVRPCSDAVDVLRGADPWPPRWIPPDPPDAALGEERGRVVRLRRSPLPRRETWFLETWEEHAEPSAARGASGLDWHPNGVRWPTGQAWSASGLRPLHGALRLPRAGWIIIGRGIALIEEGSFRERLRIESPTSQSLTDLDAEIARELSPALRDLLVALAAPPRSVTQSFAVGDVARFVAGARLRQRDPDLEITGLVADGDALVVRVDGLRGRFVAEAPSAPARSFKGYTRHGSTWQRAGSEPLRPLPSFIPDDDLAPLRFEKTWERRVPLPSAEDPLIEPRGPEPIRRELPPELEDERIVAEGGYPSTVRITGSGRVLYYAFRDSLPRWIARIAPPLPGRFGFPVRPRPPRHAVTASGGPDTAGPIADVRTPQIYFEDDIWVVTDIATRFDSNGQASPQILNAPSLRREIAPAFGISTGADHTAFEIRDLTTDADGRVYFLTPPGRRLHIIDPAGERVSIPLHETGGAFDLQRVADTICVLGTGAEDFWVLAVDRAPPHAKRRLPPPPATLERDRVGMRITALGSWDRRLLFLHDALYSLAILPRVAKTSVARPSGTSVASAEWDRIIAWPGQDPMRLPHYGQTPPRRHEDTLFLSRPWGVIEGWRRVGAKRRKEIGQ